MLAPDELRDVGHRSRTIEGIHSDEVLEDRRLQLAQVFPHAVRLELEGADGASLLIELIGLGVVEGDVVEVDVDASCELDVGTSLLQLGEGLQSEEVHLDESCRLDDVSVVLCTVGLGVLEVGVVGSTHRHPVADGVAADDESASVDACAANGALEHLGVLDGVGLCGVDAGFSFLQLARTFNSIGEVHLHVFARLRVLQSVGDSLAPGVAQGQGHLLHACHILDAVLRGHRGIGDDMCAVLVAILLFHPLQHASASVVVEVSIDIGQGDTVGVEETLEQEVVLQRVELGDAQTVGHDASGSRSSSRSHHHAEFIACRVDEVLHDEEVAGETHRLHDVKLEPHSFQDLLGKSGYERFFIFHL